MHRLATATLVEGGGLAFALVGSLSVVAVLASGDRAWLLFYDGDSVLPALVAGSLRISQPQDWALSPVLFLPELSLFLLLDSLGLTTKGTFLAYAVASCVILYVSLRFLPYAAGLDRHRRKDIASALLGFAFVLLLISLDRSDDRNSLEVASLVVTGTYYGATTVAMLLSVALVARLVSADRPRFRLGAAVTGIAALSTMSNPIYLAWCTTPLILVVLLIVRAKRVGVQQGATIIALLFLGVGSGIALRLPFSEVIVSDVATYARFDRVLASLEYYAGLISARAATADGLVAVLLTGASIGACSVAYRIHALRRNTAGILVCGFGMIAPLVILVGSVLLGTQASRYLAALFFAPVAGLIVILRMRLRSTGVHRLVRALGVLAAISAAFLAACRLNHISRTLDPDLRCVIDWIESAEGTGAGQFWTVRSAKAYLDEPNRLLQVDQTMSPYRWLINQADFEDRKVSFLITGPNDAGFEPVDEHARKECGAFTIHTGVSASLRGSG